MKRPSEVHEHFAGGTGVVRVPSPRTANSATPQWPLRARIPNGPAQGALNDPAQVRQPHSALQPLEQGVFRRISDAVPAPEATLATVHYLPLFCRPRMGLSVHNGCRHGIKCWCPASPHGSHCAVRRTCRGSICGKRSPKPPHARSSRRRSSSGAATRSTRKASKRCPARCTPSPSP
jgi:hypothetical protein